MSVLCERGCRNLAGKPKKHARLQDCPRFRAEEAAKKGGTINAGRTVGPPTASPSPKPDDAPPPTPPPAPKPKGSAGWAWGSRPATTVAAAQAPTAPPTIEWVLGDDAVDSFWDSIFALLEKGFNLLAAFLEIPPPKEAFDKSQAQILTLRRSTRTGLSHFFRTALRVETKERAEQMIFEFSGLVGLSGMFFALGAWAIREVPKSPRLARMRAKKVDAAKWAKEHPGEAAPLRGLLRFRRRVVEAEPAEVVPPKATGAPA